MNWTEMNQTLSCNAFRNRTPRASALQNRGFHRQALCLLTGWLILFLMPGIAFSRVLELIQQQADAKLNSARGLTVSADGRHVFVESSSNVIVFNRTRDSGTLDFQGVTAGSEILAVSPDGRNLYLEQHLRLRVTARNPATGAVTWVEDWQSGMSGIGDFYLDSAAISPDGRHLYAVSSSDASLVIFARQARTGALHDIATLYDGEGDIAGLAGARHVAVSADGARVYVTSRSEGSASLTAFQRDPSTGDLIFLGTILDSADGQPLLNPSHLRMSPDHQHLYVAVHNGFSVFRVSGDVEPLSFVGTYGSTRADSFALSSDGRFLYATHDFEDGIRIFARDPQTGALDLHGIHTGGIAGLGEVEAVAVSADDRHVYVASPNTGGWTAVFERDADNGQLDFVEIHREDVSGDADGLSLGHFAVAPSPEGRHLYVVSRLGDAMTVMARSPETGHLEFVATYDQELTDLGLSNPEGVTVSPDGRNVYAISDWPNYMLMTLTRDASTGELEVLDTHFDDQAGVDGLRSPRSVAVSPDGRSVYVAGRGDDAIAAFVRNPETGELTFLEAYFDGVGGIDGLTLVSTVIVSTDGRYLYAAALGGDSIVRFRRDPASGKLTFLGFLPAGLADSTLSSLALSPDGTHLYAIGSTEIAAFERDVNSGALRFLEKHSDFIAAARTLAVSPDGSYLYAFGDRVAVFTRDLGTGSLQLIETQSFPRFARYWGPNGTLSPDGRHLYVLASVDSTLETLLALRKLDGPCRPSPESLCLRGNRFQVTLDWRNPSGQSGSARGVPLGTDDSGLLWFFSSDNWEMLIKVLDGCSLNDRFWVFAAANTDVEYTLRVTDLLAGVTQSYSKPQGLAAPAITDTEAFATCTPADSRAIAAKVERSNQQPVNTPIPPVDLTRDATLSLPQDQAVSAPLNLGDALKNEVPRFIITGLDDKCLDVEGAAAADGTPVNLYSCHRQANQRWQVWQDCSYNSCSADFELRGLAGQCLQPATPDGAGTPLVIGPCGGPEDRWSARGDFPRKFQLEHVDRQLCADVEGARSEDGTPVNLYHCNGNANQDWQFQAVRCVASPLHHCLAQSRFQIEIEWRDFNGATGLGRAIRDGSADSGLYWFFDPGNWEVLVKVLDGCQINGHQWVFAAATTNVEYTLRVTDTESGQIREYFNPLGRSAPTITDTSAFAACSPP